MITIIGLILFGIFLFLSGMHFYWGFGGKWGIDAALPSNENNVKVLNPGLLACFVVGFGLLACGILVLVNTPLLPLDLPPLLANYGLWALGSIFLARALGDFKYVGFFKTIKHTRFAQMDSRYFSPLCLLLAMLVFLLKYLQL